MIRDVVCVRGVRAGAAGSEERAVKKRTSAAIASCAIGAWAPPCVKIARLLCEVKATVS